MPFPPIAIVGRACLLPGALSPEELWSAVREGRDLIRPVPEGRWGVPRDEVVPGPGERDRAWTDRGGYVTGFETVWDATGFAVPAAELEGLDPLFLWVLHTARAALVDAGPARGLDRTGAIFGLLSFPSRGMARFAEGVWLGDDGAPADARERFMSGLPALLLKRALGLGGRAFTLDAACASSLYAVKLACDALHDGRADAMLTGAVCRSDDLFIHVGFTALKALSRSGRSRPFHRDADGLLPAEGAGFVVLRRLEDARRDGDRVHGVIRGVGLANDGRGRGFLAPCRDGQVRAMRRAYEVAGFDPASISLLECHATGTAVGDATEVESSAEVFAAASDLPVGSLKGNLGHPITAAGVAGLIKVLEAMRAGERPPTLHVDEPSPAFAGTPLRPLRELEPWPERPRRAGISAFGFGGNDAHLIVEEPTDGPLDDVSTEPGARPEPIAVVGLGAVLGGRAGRDQVEAALLGDAAAATRAETVEVELGGLRFPPHDLGRSAAQQLALLSAAREAAAEARDLPRESTAVVVGMGTDPEVARWGARWRLLARHPDADPRWLALARDAVVPPLEAAAVVGTMPNVVANRVSSQLDLWGPSFSVSAEEGSGLVALEVAVRALRSGESDAALAGAVDFSCEPVHRAAAEALLPPDRQTPGDAAVVLALRRLADAERRGDRVLAVLDRADKPQLCLGLADGAESLVPRLGHAHAASGLVHLAAAVLALHHRRRPDGSEWRSPDRRSASVVVTDMAGGTLHATLVEAPGDPGPLATVEPSPAPRQMLRFPAHPEPVTLPPLPDLSTPRRMDPAPSLPLLLDRPPEATAPPRQTEPMPRLSPEPSRPAPHRPTTPDPEVASRLRAHVARVAELHRAFLAQQDVLHRRFLDLRARAASLLLGGAGQAPPPPADTSPPAPPEPVAAGPPPAVARPGAPRDPRFGRHELERHASGRISEVFGPGFADQDDLARQVRMPEPPLLLADRVTGLDAEPHSMGLGTIWTETDVTSDAWYLHDAVMPAGIMVEAGQADLMLISYLGADRLNRGERVYRLLGCELTYHGALPRPGETLAYRIEVDGHASQGDVRLFFFHYDCTVGGRLALSVRGGQAGFFTDSELAESAGVLWDPATTTPADAARVDPPRVAAPPRKLDRSRLEAWAAGDGLACFGPGFELLATHTRTPRIPDGRMLLLDEIADLDPAGGPWGRGYLRASTAVHPDDWFFPGHFKNDPCMPGTLMLEGCLEAMACYLAGLGFTLTRDGWRFEPVTEAPFLLRCRGQVTPNSRRITYEVFVEELTSDPIPTLWADLLCTVDGLKVFHARRVGLHLVPDWPLTSRPELLARHVEPQPVATLDGLPLGYASLLACAWGRPSDAFGPRYRVFDGTRRVARLPGPPYHFMSRVVAVEGEPFLPRAGAACEVEYDVPADAWYFGANGWPTMPFSVLLEVALQPCGWLASYVGSALDSDVDLSFRNLDGTGTLLAEVPPDAGTVTTKARLTRFSRTAGTIIVSFDVACAVGGTPVWTMETTFGFFEGTALANQVGLPTTEEQRRQLVEPATTRVELTDELGPPWTGPPRLAAAPLLMLDRVTGLWPEGGRLGLGRVRAEKDVDPREWFFAAHFFQDPVQPGSLGLEAMVQGLQLLMLAKGLHDGVPGSRFEPLASGLPLTWKYRGQVLPTNRTITLTLDLTGMGRDERGPWATAEASLWVDGMRIYEATNLGMRVVSPPVPLPDVSSRELTLDPAVDAWILDHRPTWTVPAAPFMWLVEALASSSPVPVVGLRDVRVRRWLVVDRPRRLRVVRRGDSAHLLEVDGEREELVASATLLTGAFPSPPTPLPPLEGAEAEDPYASGELFHGPALRILRSLVMGRAGSSGRLDASGGGLPRGLLNPALLDGATHGIPHDRLHLWSEAIPSDRVAYPVRVPRLDLYGPTPTSGEVRCETRFAGFAGAPDLPVFHLQLIHRGRVWADLELVEGCFPKGPLGAAPPKSRRAFLRDRVFVPGLGLATHGGDETVLDAEALDRSDWLPGTVAAVYGTRDPELVAVKEHLAGEHRLHPGLLPEALPLTRSSFTVERLDRRVVVRRTAPSTLDLGPVRDFWAAWFDRSRWPVEDLCYGLVEHFVDRVVLVDPAAYAAAKGSSLLYLGNHQVGVESLLFSILASGLNRVPTVTLAKAEHRTSWLGRLIRHLFGYPGVRDPEVITFFDRSERTSLPAIVEQLAAQMQGPGRSVMVHVEGTRSLSCRTPVTRMSGAFLDMALRVGAPIVPVRFVGALPVKPPPARLEFPVGMGRQEIWFGRPIPPPELASLTYGERKQLVVDAVNALGPSNEEEQPLPPRPELAAAVGEWVAHTGASPEHATILRVLQRVPDPCPETSRLLAAVTSGRLEVGTGPTEEWLAELAGRLFGDHGPRVVRTRAGWS